MTTTTSHARSETIAGWSPIGPLVSGMGSSVAFTLLTGLAERPVFPLPSAFRTCYGPRYLSAQGQSRDLRHVSPMPARCGNSVLRDMAHMGICPIDSCKPHEQVLLLKQRFLVRREGSFTAALTARLSNDSFSRNPGRRRAIFLNWSSHVEKLAFRLPDSSVHTSKCTACCGLVSRRPVSSLL